MSNRTVGTHILLCKGFCFVCNVIFYNKRNLPQGMVKLYNLPDDGTPEPGRIFSHIPSSDPTDVVVRVYIVRVSILVLICPCAFVGSCMPLLLRHWK